MLPTSGLWPSRNDTSYPSNCNNNAFDPSQISDLLPEMQVRWPNLLTSSSPNSFWEHEWDKHGTCAQSDSKLASEHDFFAATLGLSETYELGSYLSSAGIVPSSDKYYTAAQMSSAIQSQIGVQPLIMCTHGDNMLGDDEDLAAIALCVDKDVNLMHCDANVIAHHSEACYASDHIYMKPLHGSAQKQPIANK